MKNLEEGNMQKLDILTKFSLTKEADVYIPNQQT
jgi:hypothetical protein